MTDPFVFDEKLLEFIVCPLSKGKLIYQKDKNCLFSPDANCTFPIRDGIPILLEEEATHLA